MGPRSVLAMFAVVSSVACGHEGEVTPPASTAAHAAPEPVAVVSSAAAPASVKNLSTIMGTVVTDPYNAIKKGAVVYLEDGPKQSGASMSAVIDNHDMTFVPFLSVIPAGGTITFGNTDPVSHNAFSPDGEGWDIGLIPTHGAIPKTFDKPNVYAVLCNVHKNMLAYIVVTPSGYFAKTDAEGKYVLNVPPGTYRVTAWSPRLKPTTQSVTAAGSEVTLNFALGR